MSRWFWMCVVVVGLAVPAAAQTTADGSVRGVVTDQQGGVLPGVRVSATSVTAPGVHQAVTDGAGRYRLGELPPGDYTVVAELSGFARFERAPVTMRAGLNVDVDIEMQVGGVDETVRVVQETPLLETQRATQVVNVSGELLRSMPLSERREWFGALMLAPGVTTSAYLGNQQFFYVHGADFNANVVQIDGADVTSAGSALLYTVGLNTDAIDDVQIKTSGVDASAPLGVGGIVNIALAAGTNVPRGATSLFFQPRRWNDSNIPGGTASSVDQTMVDLSLGGPIVKDHFWAFGSYRFTDIHTGVSRTATQLEALRGLIPGFEPFDNVNRSHIWLAKLTGQLGPSHQVSGLYQQDANPAYTTDGYNRYPRTEVTGGTAASARWSAVWSDHFTTRLGASFNDKRRQVKDPAVDGPTLTVYNSTIAAGGRLFGVTRLASRGAPAYSWSDELNSKVTLSFDATLVAQGLLGAHELQFGIYSQPRLRVGQRAFFENGGFVAEESYLRHPGDYSSATAFHQRIMDGVEVSYGAQAGQDHAIYIQDAWRPHPRLTVNAGVRLDHIQWRDRQYDLPGVRTTAIGPRLGLNYAITSDARDVLRAHWVRVHSKPYNTAAVPSTSNLGARDLYDLDFDGIFETVFVTPAVVGANPTRLLDSGLRQPSVQEWGAGYGHQFAGGVTAAVDFLHREFRDRVSYVETNGRYDGQIFAGYVDERYNDILEVTNNRWNTPVYQSLELSITKRSDRLQGMASYVRQWRHIAGTWQPHDPAAFIQPDAFDNDKGIGAPTALDTSGLDANSLSGYSMTQISTSSGQWQDHVLRLGVSGVGPWGLLMATNYTWQSGAWSGPITTMTDGPDPSFGPTTVVLSNGRVVSNPLATTVRFAFPTRGEGQLKTPPLHVWNIRVGKSLALRTLRCDLAIDVFNVTNNGADTSFNVGATQTFDPSFGSTIFRQLPRSAQVTVRLAF